MQRLALFGPDNTLVNPGEAFRRWAAEFSGNGCSVDDREVGTAGYVEIENTAEPARDFRSGRGGGPDAA